MGGRLAFLYAGISGDFGEYCYPSGVKHYLFSPSHNHEGFWCGDRLARESFARMMKQKYGSLCELNQAWNTQFASWQDDLMPAMPFNVNSLARRLDFASWYTDALYDFSDAACKIIRGHFPATAIGIPLGFAHESLVIGQIKSMSSKLAARHQMIARWTGMAYLGDFAHSNVLARRFASAAHFYGAEFGTEAALTLTRENAANGLYESLANGASIIHDDPQNIIRAEDIHRQLRPQLFVDPPKCSCAVLYPLYDELLEIGDFQLQEFLDRAAVLRRRCDYEICDHYMLNDGFLDEMEDLLVIVSSTVPEQTAEKLEAFIAKGGRVWLCADSRISLLGDSGKQTALTITPHTLKDHTIGQQTGGLFSVETPPLLEPFMTLSKRHGDAFYTVHKRRISRYLPERAHIDIL